MSTQGQRISERIKALKLKKIDVAKALGVSNSSISDWANDVTKNIEGRHLLALCSLLKMPADYMLHGTGEAHAEPTKYPAYEPPKPFEVRENTIQDAQCDEALELIKSLSEFDRIEALRFLRLFVATKKSPPPTAPMAQTLRTP